MSDIFKSLHTQMFNQMIWSVFPHSTVNTGGSATVDDVIRDGQYMFEYVFDYVVPEYRLAINIRPSEYSPHDDTQYIIDQLNAKNYRYITISEHINVARDELVAAINTIYVLGKQDQQHILTPRLQGDAGWDLVCDADTVCEPGAGTDIPSQVYLEIPNHLYAIVQARSSTSKKRLLVLPGVIDPSYRGQIFTMTFNPTTSPVTVKKGERISQLLFFHRVTGLSLEATDKLRPSERGSRGFGSTG